MRKFVFSVFTLFTATLLTACGDFEWFPKVTDITPPTLRGTVGGISFSNSTTIYPSLPATAYLYGSDSVSEPVTLYYTTSGIDPNTSSNIFGSAFTVADNSWILKFFGKDKAGNSSGILTVKFKK